MKFDSLQQALTHYLPYQRLRGIVLDNNKIVKSVFVGISDPIVSHDIYLGIEGTFPTHTFTKSDLDNIECWVVFNDGEILLLNEVLKNDYISEVVDYPEFRHEISLTNEWSEPLDIPKGLHIRMIFQEETNMDIEIKDNSDIPQIYKNSVVKIEGGRHNIRYTDFNGMLANMIKPKISVKLTDSNATDSKDISILFVPEIIPEIH